MSLTMLRRLGVFSECFESSPDSRAQSSGASVAPLLVFFIILELGASGLRV